MKVKDIMTKNVVTIEREDTLRSALILMRKHDIHHLPVVNGEKLVGIVSDKDIYRPLPSLVDVKDKVDLGEILDTIRVKKIMSHPVKAVAPSMDAQDLARFLLKYKFRCFPVVSGGKVAGIITTTDLLRYVAQGWVERGDEGLPA